MNRLGLSSLLCPLLAIGIVAGCSSKPDKPPTFPVTGTVTRNGQPVAGATLIFVPSAQGAEAAFGTTDAEGKYQLTTFTSGDGARPGEYRVKVTQYDVPATPAGELKNLSHEEEQKIYKEEETPAPPPKNLLPPKYENETTSGITHTVKDGPTTLDIKIE